MGQQQHAGVSSAGDRPAQGVLHDTRVHHGHQHGDDGGAAAPRRCSSVHEVSADSRAIQSTPLELRRSSIHQDVRCRKLVHLTAGEEIAFN